MIQTPESVTPNAQVMIRMLLTGIAVVLTGYLDAQTPTIKTVLPVESGADDSNSKNLAVVVVSRFNSEMNLNAEQKQKVTEIISVYLDEKAKIAPLMSANKNDYVEKQASYFKTLRIKLKDVLVRTQLHKFMLLKPKPEEKESCLYYVYY